MPKKQPNRLAELIDHQAFAGSALPKNLADNISLYSKVTNEVKTLLVDCLPEEILSECWVVGHTSQQLTLSVSSVTAANHMRYLKDAYISVLKEQSPTFKQLEQIRIVVANFVGTDTMPKGQSAQSVNSSQSKVNRPLSQNTKRTISQALKHVTTDEKLKKALLKLIDE